MKFELPTFTYQTRLDLSAQEELILDACATHLNTVERKIFARIAAGENPSDLKS
jgi:hypothetical protein